MSRPIATYVAMLLVALPPLSGCGAMMPATVCERTSQERLNLYLSTFGGTVPVKEGEATKEVEAKVLVASSFDLGAPPVAVGEARDHVYVFVTEEDTCGAATFYALVQVMGITEPCLMRVVRTLPEIADLYDTCNVEGALRPHEDVVYCHQIVACHVDLDGVRTLAKRGETKRLFESDSSEEKPPKTEEVDKKLAVEGAEGEEKKHEDAKDEAEEVEEEKAPHPFGHLPVVDRPERKASARVLLALLADRARARLHSFQTSEWLDTTTVLRRIFSFPTVDELPPEGAGPRVLRVWFENHAYQKVRSYRDLRFGDLLLETWEDERVRQSRARWKEVDPLLPPPAYRDRIAMYVGFGIVGTYREGWPVFEPLGRGYTAAYRLEPAFALSMFSLPGDMARELIPPREADEARAPAHSRALQPGIPGVP